VNGLNLARHTTGDRSAYIGTKDVAEKWADYFVGTHEDGYIRFTFERSEFLDNFVGNYRWFVVIGSSSA